MAHGARMGTQYSALGELERVVFDEAVPLGWRLLALDVLLSINEASAVVPQCLFDGTQQAIH
jgi:hypothetical protein